MGSKTIRAEGKNTTLSATVCQLRKTKMPKEEKQMETGGVTNSYKVFVFFKKITKIKSPLISGSL